MAGRVRDGHGRQERDVCEFLSSHYFSMGGSKVLLMKLIL